MLLEETDVASRVQTIRPVAEPPAKSIETLWRLGEDGSAIVGCYCPYDEETKEHTGEHIYRR